MNWSIEQNVKRRMLDNPGEYKNKFTLEESINRILNLSSDHPDKIKFNLEKNVLQRWMNLPLDHPDRSKFAYEQARLRIGSNAPSHLIDLVEPNWMQDLQLQDLPSI
jgi:hypothetical protein